MVSALKRARHLGGVYRHQLGSMRNQCIPSGPNCTGDEVMG